VCFERTKELPTTFAVDEDVERLRCRFDAHEFEDYKDTVAFRLCLLL